MPSIRQYFLPWGKTIWLNWKKLLGRQNGDCNVVHFPTLSEVITSNPHAKIPRKMKKYTTALASLITEFNLRFHNFSTMDYDIRLFSTPFSVNMKEDVQEDMQLQLIKFQCHDYLRICHRLLSLCEFYKSLDSSKFSLMKRLTQSMPSLFGSSYIRK